MKPRFAKYILPLAALSFCALPLSGCGRNGAPELPPSAYVKNDKGQLVRKPKPKPHFFMDGLIGADKADTPNSAGSSAAAGSKANVNNAANSSGNAAGSADNAGE